MIRARTVAPSALVNFPPAVTPMARVRLNAIVAATSQAALAWNDFEGRCASGPGFEVGDDLLDDRVTAVLRLGFDQRAGVVGEDRVIPPDREQSLLLCGRQLRGVAFRDPAHDQPARHGVRCEVNAR